MIPSATTTMSPQRHPHQPSVEEMAMATTATTTTTDAVTTTLTRKRCQAEFQRLPHLETSTSLLSSSSSTSSASSPSACSSLLDFQSLQSSLKRVRLSMSPGELRLERDLRNLVTSEGWNKVESHLWLFGGDKSSKLEQILGDPLRLVLLTNQVSVFLQIPRRYPHRPPVVSRVIYPASARRTTSSTSSSSSTSHSSSSSSGGSSSIHNNSGSNNTSTTSWSPMQQQQQQLRQPPRQPPRGRIERILVHEAPPIPSNDECMFGVTSPSSATTATPTSIDSNNNDNSTMAAATTVIYNEWSPVKRLGDLLRFVIDVLETKQERQDVYCAGSYPGLLGSSSCSTTDNDESLMMSWDAGDAQQQLQRHHNHPHPPRNNNNIVTPSQTDRLKLYEEELAQHHQRIHRNEGLMMANQLAAVSLKSSSMDGCGGPATPAFFVEEHKSMDHMECLELDSSDGCCEARKRYGQLPFPPNRFDVGYDKAIPTTSTTTSSLLTSSATASSTTMNTTAIPFAHSGMPIARTSSLSFDWTGSSEDHHMDL